MADQEQSRDQGKLLGLLCSYLAEKFSCHTAILYGSRARGDWDVASDIDVIAFRDAGAEAGHVAQRWQGLFLDLFLYPTATKPAPDWLRLQGGRILFQRGSDGDDVLSAVEGLLASGPERLGAHDVQTRRLWAEKMLARAEKNDAEGNYRRHWLLMTLLEDYFALRGQWYLGPKTSLAFLQREKPQEFAVLCKALEPSASITDLRAAVAMVIEVQDPAW